MTSPTPNISSTSSHSSTSSSSDKGARKSKNREMAVSKEHFAKLSHREEARKILTELKANVKTLNEESHTGKGRLNQLSVGDKVSGKKDWEFSDYGMNDKAVENALTTIETELNQLFKLKNSITPHKILKKHIRPYKEDRQWIQDWKETEKELQTLKTKLNGTRVYTKLNNLKTLVTAEKKASSCFQRLAFMENPDIAQEHIKKAKAIRETLAKEIKLYKPTFNPSHLKHIRKELSRLVKDLEVMKKMGLDKFYPNVFWNKGHIGLDAWTELDKIKNELVTIDLILSNKEIQKLFNDTISLYCKNTSLSEEDITYRIRGHLLKFLTKLPNKNDYGKMLDLCEKNPGIKNALIDYLHDFAVNKKIRFSELNLLVEHPELKIFQGISRAESKKGAAVVRELLLGTDSEGYVTFARKSRSTGKMMAARVDKQAYKDFDRASRIAVRNFYITNVHPDPANSKPTGEQVAIPKPTTDKLCNKIFEGLNIPVSTFSVFTRMCQQGLVADLGITAKEKIVETSGMNVIVGNPVWQTWSYDKKNKDTLTLHVYMPHPLQLLDENDNFDSIKDHQGKPMNSFVTLHREISVPFKNLAESAEKQAEMQKDMMNLMKELKKLTLSRETDPQKKFEKFNLMDVKIRKFLGDQQDLMNDYRNKFEAWAYDRNNDRKIRLEFSKMIDDIVIKLKEKAIADFLPNISVLDTISPVCSTIEDTLNFL